MSDHHYRAGLNHGCFNEAPNPEELQNKIEPWLATLFQSEHLSLLLGNGFTTAIAQATHAPLVDMRPIEFGSDFSEEVNQTAHEGARQLGRTDINFEDQVRTVIELIAGLRIFAARPESDDTNETKKRASNLLLAWQGELNSALSSLVRKILTTEQGIAATLNDASDVNSSRARRMLGSFLLAFGSRAATRERLHIFTLNYDRLIEYGCDLLGLRVIDRFVGMLTPQFHASRVDVDFHYNPPGMRGEPKYLEGVVRLTKLHGSIDWQNSTGPSNRLEVTRSALPFGANCSSETLDLSRQLLVYPNPAKDVETLEFPYAEMFRDFASAVCRPNSVVVTYGYGFGDNHVNRTLHDMLSIPSTHLVIISFDDANGCVQEFLASTSRESQITLLMGSHFGGMSSLVNHYLPKPAIDRNTWRMIELLKRRAPPAGTEEDGKDNEPDENESLL